MELTASEVINESGNKKPELVVYVYNAVEDEWSFISTVADERKRLELIADTEDATDAYFLAMGTESDFIYVSPKPISETSDKRYLAATIGTKIKFWAR